MVRLHNCFYLPFTTLIVVEYLFLDKYLGYRRRPPRRRRVLRPRRVFFLRRRVFRHPHPLRPRVALNQLNIILYREIIYGQFSALGKSHLYIYNAQERKHKKTTSPAEKERAHQTPTER
jgi:hypothetical protein